MAINKRQQQAEALAAELKAALAQAIKDESADGVDKVLSDAVGRIAALSKEADGLEEQLESANAILKAKGVKALPPEVQKMVDLKVAAGLPYDDAVEVALRQHEHNSRRAAGGAAVPVQHPPSKPAATGAKK